MPKPVKPKPGNLSKKSLALRKVLFKISEDVEGGVHRKTVGGYFCARQPCLPIHRDNSSHAWAVTHGPSGSRIAERDKKGEILDLLERLIVFGEENKIPWGASEKKILDYFQGHADLKTKLQGMCRRPVRGR